MRVPGFTGSLGAGVGSQDSLAMQFSSKGFLTFTLLQLNAKS
jgi:hypothetical protein